MISEEELESRRKAEEAKEYHLVDNILEKRIPSNKK